MPIVLLYLLKLSISLAIVFLFYQLVLRKLTFYNWNRWYLLGYTILSFLIALIDITPVLKENQWTDSGVVQWVPIISTSNTNTEIAGTAGYHFGAWNLVGLLLIAGMIVLFTRLIIQLLSFRKIMKKAKLVYAEGMKLYQVDGDIIPFSFGNSIFINRELHTEDELREIISHEFVHVKQRHSLDIIWGEVLCLLNWYNPFVWLLRRSMRQNLEFIADHKVLECGIDPRQYQYLLLKVIGNNKFSIAPKFNFSSLKKRIAMMNKMKSAGVHIVKFLFVLPLVAVLLIAFRKNDQLRYDQPNDVHMISDKVTPKDNVVNYLSKDLKKDIVVIDTVPRVKVANSKGNFINIIGVNGTCTVVVTDKGGKELEKVELNTWKDNPGYEEKYGEILPPPITIEPVIMVDPVVSFEPIKAIEPIVAVAPVISVSPIGPIKIAVPCDPVQFDTTPSPSITVAGVNLSGVSSEYEITKTNATIKLKNGVTETYNLTNLAEKKKFEDKYGKIIDVTTAANKNGYTPVAVTSQNGRGVATAYTPYPSNGVLVVDETGHAITGREDIIVTITKNTTREQLEEFKKQMKAKGVELSFDDIGYENGKLFNISGSMKANGSQSNFTANDFDKLVLAMIVKDGKTWFKVSTRDDKVVI